jgi:uncharacterized protein YegP (UPF0339 family)
MQIEVWQSTMTHDDGITPISFTQQWYWRARSSNGKITTDAEAFPTKGNAIRAAKNVVKAFVNEFSGTASPLYFNKPQWDAKHSVYVIDGHSG